MPFLRQLQLYNLRKTISYYVTTPIFYVNSSPHIGHVYTLLLADAINIFQRIKSNKHDTIFSSGTDEHGIKIQNAADALKCEYQTFCDINSNKFLDLFNLCDTTLSDFVRTTEPRHKRAVSFVWNELQNKGLIYKSTYSGWYCNSDETFVPESQVTKKELNDGSIINVDQNENLVEWSTEQNYMFRLSNFQGQILDWLEKDEPLTPKLFNEEAKVMVKRSDFHDISISRPTKRLKWAIPVPADPDQAIYVWLDALTNYLTVVGYPCGRNELKRWPIDCQVIGKDIIKFHAVYWPGFLIALSLPLPRKLICHSHWLLNSYKMSKSRGNVVYPQEEIDALTSDGLRYYLLRAGTPHSDTDFNRQAALNRINSELADTYGNLMSRCCGIAINPDQVIPTRLSNSVDSDLVELRERLDQARTTCERHYGNANFYKGIDEILSILRFNNSLYERTKPWKLVKELQSDVRSFETYSNLQAITFETLRICSILLQPVIPKISRSALDKLNTSSTKWEDTQVNLPTGNPSLDLRHLNKDSNSVLFKRLKT